MSNVQRLYEGYRQTVKKNKRYVEEGYYDPGGMIFKKLPMTKNGLLVLVRCRAIDKDWAYMLCLSRCIVKLKQHSISSYLPSSRVRFSMIDEIIAFCDSTKAILPNSFQYLTRPFSAKMSCMAVLPYVSLVFTPG